MEHDQTSIRKNWKTVGFSNSIEVFVLFGSAFLLVHYLTPLMDTPLGKHLIVWFVNVALMMFIWISSKTKNEHPSDLGLTSHSIKTKTILRTLLKSLLIFISATTAFVLGSIIMSNITGIPEQADMSSYKYLKGSPLLFALTLIGVFIISSFGEEFIYRGYLMKRLKSTITSDKYGNILSVTGSSIIFGLIHFDWGPMGMVQTGLMGMAMSLFYVKYKTIWPLVLAHAYMDTLLIMQMYMAQ